jgi:hypothetical protein
LLRFGGGGLGLFGNIVEVCTLSESAIARFTKSQTGGLPYQTP